MYTIFFVIANSKHANISSKSFCRSRIDVSETKT